jgi:hypothetical protein
MIKKSWHMPDTLKQEALHPTYTNAHNITTVDNVTALHSYYDYVHARASAINVCTYRPAARTEHMSDDEVKDPKQGIKPWQSAV